MALDLVFIVAWPSPLIQDAPFLSTSRHFKKTMAKIKIALVRFIQACFFVFYLYVGMVYAGIVLLLPLGIFYHLYRLFHLLSFNDAIAATLALATVGGLGYVLVQVQDIIQIILTSGIRLAELGLDQLRELGALAQSITKQP
jgi:hypothetical protein